MLKRLNFIIIFSLMIGGIVFALSCSQKKIQQPEKIEIVEVETNKVFIPEEETNKVEKKINLLILPFKDNSNKKNFPASGTIKTIIFNSLFDFISIVPLINIEEKESANKIYKEFKEIKPEEIFAKYNTEVIIFGEYQLQKKDRKPLVAINFNIWTKATNKILKTKYTSKNDAEIFDKIDDMIAKIIKTTLNEDLKISYMNFENFDINNGKYYLVINDRVVSFISNQDFRFNLKILAGYEYIIKLKNIYNNKIVLNQNIKLKTGETTNISHQARGNIKFIVTNNIENEVFKIFVDDKELLMETNHNISAERYIIIKVSNITKNDSYELKYYLGDGEEKTFYLPKARKVIEKYNINTYNGGSAIVKYYYSDQYLLMENKSLVIEAFIPFSSWAGINILFDNKEIIWTKYNTIKFWLYGTKSNNSYLIQLIDKNNESFAHIMYDNWKGWKQIRIPFEKIKSRMDYQDSRARVNRKIDFPIKTLNFELNSYPPASTSGKLKIIINEIELTRE
ncbi:MAG: hypothetical protein N2258_03920 [Brevinematales bacterium]|nr:hypothetical protein [Brevinematales bacterium]